MKPYYISINKKSQLLLLSLILGVSGGLVGALFSFLTTFVASVRISRPILIYFLPLAGLLIVLIYKVLKITGQGTNQVIESADCEEKVSPLLSLGIILTALLSHLCGASVGREGAAVQIGGSLASLLSKIFKIDEQTRKILVRAGLAAVFSAVFGTPLAAFLFSLELVTVGRIHYKSAITSFISSFSAFFTAHLCGAHAERFNLSFIPDFSLVLALKLVLLTVTTAFLSIIFAIPCALVKNMPRLYLKIPTYAL